MSFPDLYHTLAPAELPVLRATRFDGRGVAVTLDDLAPADRPRLRHVYRAVCRLYDTRLGMGDRPDYPALRRQLEAFDDPAFVDTARRLGSDTPAGGFGTPVARALHDIRGGGLTMLVGAAWLAKHHPGGDGAVDAAVFLSRDHARMMRSAVADLDPPARAADLAPRPLTAAELVRDWDRTAVPGPAGRPVTVAAGADFPGGFAACPLEAAAFDRVLYNLVGNAARFAADGAVCLTAFLSAPGRLRLVVENAVTANQREWLCRETRGDLGRLFAGGLTRGGTGIGLCGCADVVGTCFGVPAGQAVARGYLGARLAADRFLAWWHWPTYDG